MQVCVGTQPVPSARLQAVAQVALQTAPNAHSTSAAQAAPIEVSPPGRQTRSSASESEVAQTSPSSQNTSSAVQPFIQIRPRLVVVTQVALPLHSEESKHDSPAFWLLAQPKSKHDIATQRNVPLMELFYHGLPIRRQVHAFAVGIDRRSPDGRYWPLKVS